MIKPKEHAYMVSPTEVLKFITSDSSKPKAT